MGWTSTCTFEEGGGGGGGGGGGVSSSSSSSDIEIQHNAKIYCWRPPEKPYGSSGWWLWYVCEWISDFIPHYTGHVITYPWWNCIEIDEIHVSKSAPCVRSHISTVKCISYHRAIVFHMTHKLSTYVSMLSHGSLTAGFACWTYSEKFKECYNE